MVLGARNFSKRHVKENTPPVKSVDAITQRVTASLREAARRRRRRVSGSQNIQFEPVAKRELRPKTVFQVRVVRPTQPEPRQQSVTVQDVEMTPASPSTSSTVPVSIPRRLGRPTYKAVSPEAIEAAVPGVGSVQYVLDTLPFLRNEMLRGIIGAKVPSMKTSTVPTEMEVDISSLVNADIPTHVLLVYRQPPTKQGEQPAPPAITKSAMLIPVHSVVLAAHCANLPPLEPSSVEVIPTSSGGAKVTLPVKPLGVPAPELFSLVNTYLYTKNPMQLFSALLPKGCAVPEPLRPQSLSSMDEKLAAVRSLGQHVAQTYTPNDILQSIFRTNGVWRNVCALGIFDPAVWQPLDVVWEILLTSLSIATNQPELMAPSSSSRS
ncbi:hypothetical protein ONZ45_g9885 [Pleurotus djamor]|nr:hypothetical protein ONZ45_g9885 [Pleurotus djamor]